MRRSFYKFASLAVLLGCGGFSALAAEPLVNARDLTADARLAREQRLPIMLFFSQTHCPYCKTMRELYLEPMIREGGDRGRVLVRRIMLDEFDTIVDFEGKTTDADNLASRYNAQVTPTLVFVDPGGKQLIPALIGVGNEYFFHGELQSAIETALASVRGPKR